MKFIALKTEDGKKKGKIAFCCKMLGVKPARVLSVSGKQKSTVEIPAACRNHAGNLQ